METPFLLAFLLWATPGPLDRHGGHIDPVKAEYHFHAPASYRFRYLDAEGRIWEGNGPRPEENLSYAPDDFLWQTPFVPLLVVTSLVAGFATWRIEDRIRAALARRRRRAA